jgi:hypothetical protein
MTASRVTEEMVTRASRVLWTEVNPEYQADPRDFTDADIAAGKLREADDTDIAENRAIVRRVLEAALQDAADEQLLKKIRVRPDDTGQGRVIATHPDDGTFAATEIAFPAGQAVTLALIVTAFEHSNRPGEADRG